MIHRTTMFAALALLALAACSQPGRVRLTHPATELNRGNGGDVESLDPDYVSANNGAYVLGDCLIGLTTEDRNGNPIPGAATSWETAPDKKTWTFHLRDHVWSDGVPVTAQDFVFAWRRILEPSRAAPYAYYLWLVKNAQAVNSGKLPPNRLGIVAKDDRTLVVTLERPAPYLPQWLMHQTTYPLPRHVVLAKGDAWSKPGNYVCNGPYVFRRWIPNDHITMMKNPRFYDAARVPIIQVRYYATADSVAALKWLQSGEIDTQEPFPSSEIGWIRKNMSRALVAKPYLANTYIMFNFRRPAFRDRRLREALSMALDREALVNKVRQLGEPAAYCFVPPGTANYPGGASVDFKSLSFPERIRKAKALMTELGYGPNHHFRTTFTTVTGGPDILRLAAAIQEMMHAIYVDVDIIQMDSAVFFSTLSQGDFDLSATTWIADFNDASTFLDLLSTGAGNNYGAYSSPEFDRLYAEAQLQPDLGKRGKLMEEAEQVAMTDDAVIPAWFPMTRDLVQPYVKGWNTAQPNLRNFHRTRWLWIDQRATDH